MSIIIAGGSKESDSFWSNHKIPVKLDTVEVLGDVNCSLPKLPYPISDYPQMFLNDENQVTICGELPKPTTCLSLVNGTWQEYATANHVEKKFSVQVSLGSKHFMFGAGITSEILEHRIWKEGPENPASYPLCGVSASKDELLLIGNEYGYPNKVYRYSTKSKKWTLVGSMKKGGSMKKLGSICARCAVYKNKVFVNGDWPKYVETFDLHLNKSKFISSLQVYREYNGLGMVYLNKKLQMAAFGGWDPDDCGKNFICLIF